MNDKFSNFKVPYSPAKQFSTRVAYFSMEFALDQSLKTFSGGLGFLAGSHMRSAYELKQNMIGIGILWKFGYYDQVRNSDNNMAVLWQQKSYNFLEDTGIRFQVDVSDHPVWVAVWYLPPERFESVPMFFLTTDVPENDYLSKTITNHLYDYNPEAKIAQSIILGVGGAKLIDIINFMPEVYHLNEAHGLSAAFYLYNKYKSAEEVRKRMVFTTHTPVEAGNEKHNFVDLEKMSFFQSIPVAEIRQITGITGNIFDHSLVALRLSKIANGVSAIHGDVARRMWGGYEGIAPITSITNSQNKKYWADYKLEKAASENNVTALEARKKELKYRLFINLADQTGKWFDPNVLTIVWARRFAGYKRANLITKDLDRFKQVFCNPQRPIQVIWAGKPYPKDNGAIEMFNELVRLSANYPNIAIMTGYEMRLSKLLKQGSDVWLNNPRIPMEASGTSGMTAAMNASINLSTWDGWIPEFVENGKNGFVVPPVDYQNLTEQQQDDQDLINLLNIIEKDIASLYYNNPKSWYKLAIRAVKEVVPEFESGRMATEYYEKLYKYKR
ncbi:MAG: alpha-glucan family phosphorylase [Saprospiraceae bacterium]|jgi:starch phosphorylase|nr:alpha-glucan family phosphorylase [Saprospiraceae bacterium]MBX7179549.1 alpha-glucan family phosphorylase [Saprospiraceae bacterium]MCB0591314.1 alpha-glucan family phosphorylase [Saprospiraceae bacterium]MCO5283513.1 alpha-glucan family phosphorylase [Saprospiraceae bacterium]MCO6470330.1 alpha-glucan family phosphorylase [Saprospiraceae bacterium]